MKKIVSLVASVGFVTMLCGCPAGALPPVVGPVITGGLAAIACGWNVYAKDTGKTPPDGWEQVAMDMATNCGLDVADIVTLFGADHPVSKAAQATQDKVHAAAMGARAKAAASQSK